MGQITGQQKQEAAKYAEDFLRGWLRLLEVEHLTQPGTKERIGHTISSAFRLRYFRHAEQNWPDELVRFTERRAVHHPAFLDEFLPRWLDDLQSRSKPPPKTRSGLISFIKAQSEEKRRGTVRYDGWHHLMAVAVHNISLKYDIPRLEDDSVDGASAMAAIISAMAKMFPASSLDYTRKPDDDGQIPGREWFKKVWDSWRGPLRPSEKGRRSGVVRPDFGRDLVETEEDVFYGFFLTTLANEAAGSAKER